MSVNKYKYKAKDKDNKVYRGIVYAIDQESVIKILSEQNLFCIRCSKKIINGKKRKLTIDEMVFFSNQMAAILFSGIGVEKALNIVILSSTSKYLSSVYNDILYRIKEGESISDAISNQGLFPNLYVKMIKVGEYSGNLDKAFESVSKVYSQTRENKRKLKSAISYPILLLSSGIAVLLFLLIKIIPMFKRIFESNRTQIPVITKFLISVSSHISQYYLIYITSILSIILIALIFSNTIIGKKTNDIIKIKMPVIKKPSVLYNLIILINGMKALVYSGQTLAGSVETMSTLVENTYIERKLKQVVSEIKMGVNVSNAFARMDFYPKSFIEMLSVGDASGKVDGVLETINDFYNLEYEYEVKKAISKIEPIMIIIIGILIMIIVFSIFIPIFSIMDSIGAK